MRPSYDKNQWSKTIEHLLRKVTNSLKWNIWATDIQ